MKNCGLVDIDFPNISSFKTLFGLGGGAAPLPEIIHRLVSDPSFTASFAYVAPKAGDGAQGSRVGLLKCELRWNETRLTRRIPIPHLGDDGCYLMRGRRFVPAMYLRRRPGLYVVSAKDQRQLDFLTPTLGPDAVLTVDQLESGKEKRLVRLIRWTGDEPMYLVLEGMRCIERGEGGGVKSRAARLLASRALFYWAPVDLAALRVKIGARGGPPDRFCADDLEAIVAYSLGCREIGEFDDPESVANDLHKHRLLRIGDTLAWLIHREFARRGRSDLAVSPPARLAGVLVRALSAAHIFPEGWPSPEFQQHVHVANSNPLHLLALHRKVLKFGPGGVSRLYKNLAYRDLHSSHKGRLCALETPESRSIGLDLELALGATVGTDGSIEAAPEPDAILGFGASQIPFVAHDDGARAMMGAKNSKAALPLVGAEPPLVTTGHVNLANAVIPPVIRSTAGGVVTKATGGEVRVRDEGGTEVVHSLLGPHFTGFGCADLHHLRVQAGSQVAMNQVLAESVWQRDGKLAYGANLLVVYVPWFGYNFEDAIVAGEHLLGDSRLTSIHLHEVVHDFEQDERLLVDDKEVRPVREGDAVHAFDPLFRTRFPWGATHSLRCPPECVEGEVVAVVKPERPGGRMLEGDRLRILVAERRPIQRGDKLQGRHGNKGVVGALLPSERMPYVHFPDGSGATADLVLNPLGVISRMNLGQLIETHAGLVAKLTGKPVEAAPFAPTDLDGWHRKLETLGAPEGKLRVTMGSRTGEALPQLVTAGYQYILKLDHCPIDKIAARGDRGPRNPRLGQPSQGRPHGGQRLGEMEQWALEAHRAYEILRESTQLRSDAAPLFERADSDWPMGESSQALVYLLRALGMSIEFARTGTGGKPWNPAQQDRPSASQILSYKLRFVAESTIKGDWAGGHEVVGRPREKSCLCGAFRRLGSKRRCPICDFRVRTCRVSPGHLDTTHFAPDFRWSKTRMGYIDVGSPRLHALRLADPLPEPTEDGRKLLNYEAALDPDGDLIPLDDVAHRLAEALQPKPGRKGGSAAALWSKWRKGQEARVVHLGRTDAEAGAQGRQALLSVVPVIPVPYRGGRTRNPPPIKSRGVQEELATRWLTYERSPLDDCYRRLQVARAGQREMEDLLDDPERFGKRFGGQDQTAAATWLNEWIGHAKAIDSAVGELFDSQVEGLPANLLKGKFGLLRRHLLGKRTDFSGRAVIAPAPELGPDDCSLPLLIALRLFWSSFSDAQREQVRQSPAAHLTFHQMAAVDPDMVPEVFPDELPEDAPAAASNRKSAKSRDRLAGLPSADERQRLVELVQSFVRATDKIVLLNRAPTLHRWNVLAFRPVAVTDDYCIGLNPHVLGGFNADFDGDTMAVHLPATDAAQAEAKGKLLPSRNLFDLARSQLRLHLSQDMVLGAWSGGGGLPVGTTADQLRAHVTRLVSARGADPVLLDEMRKLAVDLFDRASRSGLSLGTWDFVKLHAELHRPGGRFFDRLPALLRDCAAARPPNPVAVFHLSGARGDATQIAQMVSRRGVLDRMGFKSTRPIEGCLVLGLSAADYFEAAFGARKVMADKKLFTADAGYLTRRMVFALREIRITVGDCRTEKGIRHNQELDGPRELWPLARRLIGRVPVRGDGHPLSAEAAAETRPPLDVRSPLTCEEQRGVCARCYGTDLSTQKLVDVGAPVGLWAAQTIGERGTQDTMRTFHQGGARQEDQRAGVTRLDVIAAFLGSDENTSEILGAFASLEDVGSAKQQDLVPKYLRLLYEVYGESVDPRHFEVLLRAIIPDDFVGLNAASDGVDSPLERAAFRQAPHRLAEAAAQGSVVPLPMQGGSLDKLVIGRRIGGDAS